MIDRTELMRQVYDEVAALTESPLYTYRTENNYLPVIGEGSCDAKIMFIGEAPGKNEAKTGRPFCGAAGKILDELLASVKINRSDIYIANIVKDRPPENRDPSSEEIVAYGPFLDRQIEIIQPKVIATLGRYSMNYILEKFGLSPDRTGNQGTIGQLHGKTFSAAPSTGSGQEASYGPITIVPLYHPAAAIYNQALKATLFEDFKVLHKFK